MRNRKRKKGPKIPGWVQNFLGFVKKRFPHLFGFWEEEKKAVALYESETSGFFLGYYSLTKRTYWFGNERETIRSWEEIIPILEARNERMKTSR